MTEHYLTHINHYLQTHTYMKVLFAFLVPLAESLPFIGTIIPGSITMSIIGVLVGRGMISPNTTLLWSSVGALVGDMIGFCIGKYYNERLRLTWLFKRYSQWLSVGEAFFRKHGGKSILIGRFVGPIRSSVPLIAGLLKMSWSRFFLAAIPSTILWAVTYLLPGVLIGSVSLQSSRHVITTFILLGLAIIVLVWLLFWTIQRSFSFLISLVSDAIDHLWGWLYDRHSLRFLLRLITNLGSPMDHHQLTMVLLAFLSLFCFLILAIVSVKLGPSVNFNEPVFYFLQSLRLPNVDKSFTIITILGDAKVIISIVLLFVATLVIKKIWRPALHLIAIILITGFLIIVLKNLIYSPRPTGFLVSDHSSSFPSGHVGLSLPVFGFIAFLTAQQMPKKWHWIPYTLTTMLIILIGYSRLYLGAHWLEDVLASLFLGLAILLSVIISYRRYPQKAFGNQKWLIFLILTIVLPWAGFGKAKYYTLMHRYTPIWPVRETTIKNWWQDPLKCVPTFRLNRFGHFTEPFNIQWVDKLSTIKQTLERKGWLIIHNKTDVQTALGRFASYKPEHHLPIFPCLYRGKPPILFMIKHLLHATTIIELRLWESDVRFKDSHLPLWVGSIDYRLPSKHLITLPQLHEMTMTWFHSGGINQLIPILSGYQWKKLKIYPYRESKKIHCIPKWDGDLLLIRFQEVTK